MLSLEKKILPLATRKPSSNADLFVGSSLGDKQKLSLY